MLAMTDYVTADLNHRVIPNSKQRSIISFVTYAVSLKSFTVSQFERYTFINCLSV